MSCSLSKWANIFGILHSTNLSSLPSSYPFRTLPTTGDPGWQQGLRKSKSWYENWNSGSNTLRTQGTRDFLSWMGPCVVCGKTRRGGVGIFCRNFCVGREGFPPCMNVWCGGCFKQSPTDPFPRQEGGDPEDESEVLTDNRDKDRYKMGRDGDHLLGVPFECDLCHFRNMNRRDP